MMIERASGGGAAAALLCRSSLSSYFDETT